jgi:hypothetical protein
LLIIKQSPGASFESQDVNVLILSNKKLNIVK